SSLRRLGAHDDRPVQAGIRAVAAAAGLAALFRRLSPLDRRGLRLLRVAPAGLAVGLWRWPRRNDRWRPATRADPVRRAVAVRSGAGASSASDLPAGDDSSEHAQRSVAARVLAAGIPE